MNTALPTVIATSVVRGSHQGESHGGVYTIDFNNGAVTQHIDWNTTDIDFAGRGADRGLRGIAFDRDHIFIAASDELFCFDPQFNQVGAWRNPYLKHCHEICVYQRMLFLTSTGFDSILAFDLDKQAFSWGFYLQSQGGQWSGFSFDPRSDKGPKPSNEQHINMVHVDRGGVFISGLRTGALLRNSGGAGVTALCSLPQGCHNARPFGEGVLLNDTQADCLRHVPHVGAQHAFKVPQYAEENIEFAGVDTSRIARQGFGRGLCVIDGTTIAGGSSPSTVSLHDLETGATLASINLTMDIRNAIHGLELWPY
ncbi:hypothetical protein A3709_13445 [Halioglobus sp. HI00S01]|uniref:hypothetical protein n=1 Tax=Halioglobus sp. HI00S01 TaxID=1822214 RepID=UPI0007C209BE|nr:hypothetical protein [Halioglobus sp. HI00S01]KZX59299.1 hypothetical protein A3709_13445 [Halioglobus sp. HI00S01]